MVTTNKPSQTGRTLLLLAVAFICSLLVAPMITAFEWDNIVDYKSEDKEVTITNALGIGNEIVDVKLDTPLLYQVRVGYSKVMQFTMNPYQDYEGLLKELEFYDMNNDGTSIQKSMDIKYWKVENITVDNYVCPKVIEEGKTTVESCTKSGTKQIEQGSWVAWDKNAYENKEVTVGLFTNVGVDETVDIIPTIAGKKLDRWAILIVTGKPKNPAQFV